MLKHVLSLTLCLSASTLAHATDSSEVCTLRPDLCDGSPSTTTPPTRIKTRSGCRPPGAYTASQANLPVCAPSKALGQTHRSASEDDDLFDEPASHTSKRGPASVAATPAKPAGPRGISFEEYLKLNALNPALSSKIADHQNAFVDRPVTASLSIPSDGVSTSVDSGAVGGAGSTTMQTPAGTMTVPVPGAGNGNGVSGSTSDGFSSPPGS